VDRPRPLDDRTKYGKDELLRSILNPSAAVGYNYRSFVVALADGRVITGLPVEEAADRLVLKTAEGQRLSLRTGEIEERKQSDLSLMPENLAQTMSDQDLVDLLAFLSTLKQPVSIVGLYHALGPVAEGDGPPALDPKAKVDPSAPCGPPTARRSPGGGCGPTPRASSTWALWSAPRRRRPSTCTPRSSPRSRRRPAWSSMPRPTSGRGWTARLWICPPPARMPPERRPSACRRGRARS
jgi:putative heme-binding domain-containing protein